MRLDPRKTGAYISRLRREKDWTQLALAEKLHITPQAVSRWETGDSFPDIELLAEMSRLFGVSIDALLYGAPAQPRPLGGRAAADEVLEQLAQGRPEQAAHLAAEDPEGVEALIDAGPLVRPSQMRKVVENMSGYRFTPEQVIELAAFVDGDLLDSLVNDLDPSQWDLQFLSEIAPYSSSATLDRMVAQVPLDGVTAAQVADLAPFLSVQGLERLLSRLPPGTLNKALLHELAAYLRAETLDNLVAELPGEDIDAELVLDLAPFLSSEALGKLVDQAKDEIQAGQLLELAAFLAETDLKQLLERLPPDVFDAETIIELAPHLDRETLARLIRGSRED
jgi:transcriptional regulator with XRE-family HTH domain